MRTLCLIVALVAAAPMARAADPVMASHKAIYKMTMASSKSTSIVSVEGQMYYDFSDSCDAWASDQKFALNYVYADEPEAKMNSQFTSHETKNFSGYDFAVQRTKNGAPEDDFVGSTSRKPDGSGVATFTQPVKTIDLPKGFLLPTQHTIEMIKHGIAGDHIFNAMLFDGSDGTGATEVNVIIGDVIKPDVNDKLAANKLLQSPARKVRLAFFPVDTGKGGDEDQPDYEMTMILHENGVVSSLQIDYDQFSLKGELQAIEAIKTPKC